MEIRVHDEHRNIHPHSLTNLSLQYSIRPDDLVEDVLSNMRVHSTKWVIQEIYVSLLVDCSSQTHSLLLTSTKIDTLKGFGRGV